MTGMTFSDDPWQFPPDPPPDQSVGAPLSITAIDDITPLDAQLGAFEKKTVPDSLKDALWGDHDPGANRIGISEDGKTGPILQTYAILDAARITNLPELLERSGLEHRCLFQGRAFDDLKNVAPWLVRLELGNSFARNLFTQGGADWQLWDKRPGIYVRSRCDFMKIHNHFRKFTRVQDERGKWYYWRFWEVQSLIAVLRTFDKRESDDFFRPPIVELIIGLIIRQDAKGTACLVRPMKAKAGMSPDGDHSF